MRNSAPTDNASSAGSPLDAFTGTFSPTKTGPLYNAGLLVVAFAMILLPLIYMSLIALTAWAVVWHLTNDTWMLSSSSGRGGFIQLILYLGPAVAGCILGFFMVKPFFASQAKTPDPITLDPAKEPLLFAFVQKICALVGSPVPGRIDVDCQVNASASLQHGLWSKDLVLTIGLPLAAGLDMRQFAGVLAHEFGHFAQGAGMRLTYVIRKINFWFARVVYERDAWDIRLENMARGTDLRLAVVLHAARGCVWLTRRILWALMHAGHAISCFMLQQMEYDADSYEAKLAGSDAFEATASRLRILNVATQMAYEDVRQSWASHRLPENLALLIEHKSGSLPAEVHQKLSDSSSSGKTHWFDTHPCDTDRVRAVRQLNEAGVFMLAAPATQLFADFPDISRTVTRHQYEKHFELTFTDQNLMSAEEILRESTASTEADAMIRRYYGNVNISLHPLLTEGNLPPVNDPALLLNEWRAARQSTEGLRAEAEKLSEEQVVLMRRRAQFNSAHRLAKAGFKLAPKEFELPERATSPGEQEIAARFALDENSEASARLAEKQAPFTVALRRRVTCALRRAWEDKGALNPEARRELEELVRLLSVVGCELERVHEIASKLPVLTVLFQNRGNHSNVSEVDKVIESVVVELKGLTAGIQERLAAFPYPFPHARGALSVAEYARSEKPAENDWHRTYLDSDSHVDRLFALNYRLVGRVLAAAESAEKMLETGDASNVSPTA